jgi:hypothetical protein
LTGRFLNSVSKHNILQVGRFGMRLAFSCRVGTKKGDEILATKITTGTTTKSKKILYWGSTGVAAFALTAIGIANLLRAPSVITGLIHLGYPAYLATILGIWKLLGCVAILSSRNSRLKEWAYAGMFFILTGAALSHTVSGDPIGHILFPVVLLGFVMTSWALQSAREAVIVDEAAVRQAA